MQLYRSPTTTPKQETNPYLPTLTFSTPPNVSTRLSTALFANPSTLSSPKSPTNAFPGTPSPAQALSTTTPELFKKSIQSCTCLRTSLCDSDAVERICLIVAATSVFALAGIVLLFLSCSSVASRALVVICRTSRVLYHLMRWALLGKMDSARCVLLGCGIDVRSSETWVSWVESSEKVSSKLAGLRSSIEPSGV